MNGSIRSGIVCAFAFVLAISMLSARELSIDERVTAQKAIEQVYWNHRMWPKENPGGKPELSAVMSDQAIRAKVDDYLRMSNALERFWQRPVTVEQLQAELDRMAKNTKDGATLQELFGALGNDSFVIAETLGRQTLVERLIRNWYANDTRFHGDAKAKAEAALAVCASVDCMKTMGGEYREATRELGVAGAVSGNPATDDPENRAVHLDESPEAFVVTAVLAEREGALETASVSWPKRSFDEWWRDERGGIGVDLDGSPRAFSLPAAPLTPCTNDTWTPTRTEVPDPRDRHTSVWTGTEMIVWGSSFASGATDLVSNTGGRYNPATDSWTATSTGANVPAGRGGHKAVWTGTEMLVWGGRGASSDLNTGGRYDPSTDTWNATATTVGVPSARVDHTAVWTGTEMIVSGGGATGNSMGFSTGGRYSPLSNTWTATSTVGVSFRRNHTAVWTGTEMIVWGGNSFSLGSFMNSGSRYNPSTDSWVATSVVAPVPIARAQHTAVWTGDAMIVWGGEGSGPELNTGGRYDPVNDSWVSTSTTAVPTARTQHTAVWTGTEMIVWGGGILFNPVNTGGRYNPLTDSWMAISTVVNAPSARKLHTAVWTGTEMIVWGGSNGSGTPFNTAGRYKPSNDTWTPVSMGATVPAARAQHAAAWTGTEMIVWGGLSDGYLKTGGRYTPATDTWTATSTGTGVPLARGRHTAVWTGTEMIVWGGNDGSELNTGGRYSPSTNSWLPTSTGASVPAPRQAHSVVWTGTEMIVWGGSTTFDTLNTGGRYHPSTDSWTATAMGAGIPSLRLGCTAVWTGTEMIVWGGFGGVSGLNTGGRYNPSTGSWAATSTGANVPAGREAHTVVWTGTEMIVWGGTDGSSGLNTGGRYNPSTDGWTATSTAPGVPPVRGFHTAAWTGVEMIVWAGVNSGYLNTGGRYNPLTNNWTATATGASVPAHRRDHTAVWTGSEMIVWGGLPNNATGGSYCACPTGAVFYRDADGDGRGSPGQSIPSCDGSIPPGYVADSTDCNDTSAAAYPGAPEINDGLDNQCPGEIGYGLTDEISGVGGFGTPGDKTTLSWTAQPGATSYEAVRSPFRDFHAGCVHHVTSSTSWSDPTIPPPGTQFFFLVRTAAPYIGSWGGREPAGERTVCSGCLTTGDWCDDSSVCTVGDSCVGTACTAGTTLSCDDGNACTADSCDPASGCVHSNNNVACDDGNACTTVDACGGGACIPGSAANCDDADFCTTDSCDPVLGCVHVNNTAPCSDGSACTINDLCDGGSCAPGATLNCDDGNVCTTDSCNPASGCVNTNNTSACDDGNACTTGDVCAGGACTGTNPPGANHLVISQIQTAGDGGTPSSDEFIEIYNPTSSPVALGGWSIQSVVSTFPFNVSRHNLFSGTVPAHGWFLVARSSYNGPVTRDSTNLAFTLPSDGNSVFLVNSSVDVSSCTSGSIVDKVAYGNGTCGEGGAAPAPAANNSILRLPGGACGNGSDTNSNSADFVSQSPSTPRNSTSPQQP